MLHSLPRKAVAQGKSSAPAALLPNLKIKTDLDCIFYLDGEEKAHIKAGSIHKLPLAPGEYELSFVGVENAADTVRTEFEMPSVDKLYKVSLQPQRNQRLQTEAAARQQAEQQRKAEEERRRRAEEQRRVEEEQRRRAVEEEQRRAEEKVKQSTASGGSSSDLSSNMSWISSHRDILSILAALSLVLCGVLALRDCGGHTDSVENEVMDTVSYDEECEIDSLSVSDEVEWGRELEVVDSEKCSLVWR